MIYDFLISSFETSERRKDVIAPRVEGPPVFSLLGKHFS